MGSKTTTDKQATAGDLVRQVQGGFAVTPALTPQVEQFWTAQENVLLEAEAFSRGWFERRHEAAGTALDAARQATGRGTMDGAALRAMADWNRGSWERMAEDVQQWIKCCTQCAGHFAGAEAPVGRTELDQVEKVVEATGKPRRSTPK